MSQTTIKLNHPFWHTVGLARALAEATPSSQRGTTLLALYRTPVDRFGTCRAELPSCLKRTAKSTWKTGHRSHSGPQQVKEDFPKQFVNGL